VIEREPLRPYYLLHGEETFLLERGLDRLRARVVGSGRTDAVGVVWGDDPDERVSAALVDLASPSLFGGVSLLVVRRAEALVAAQEDEVLALLPRLGDGARLVLVAKALDQRRRLHTACAKDGAALGFPRLADLRAAGGWVTTLARERGHAIAAPAIEMLLARVGADCARLDDEIEKLALHVGPRATIEQHHVETLVAASRAHAIEELTDRLARHDAAGAIRTLRALVASGEPPIRILAFLAANLRRALHVAELTAMGLREEEIAGRLGMPGWLVARSARRGTPADLERALDVLLALDAALKSSRPEAAVFERSLLAIAGARAGAA